MQVEKEDFLQIQVTMVEKYIYNNHLSNVNVYIEEKEEKS